MAGQRVEMARKASRGGAAAAAAALDPAEQWSAAIPLCACSSCVRAGYVSQRDAQRMRAASEALRRGARSRGGGKVTAAVDDVLCRIEERHCRLFGPGTADLSPQHIEEVLALTGGDVDATARLLVDFRGASTKEVVVACDQPDDPQCAVCWSETKDTMIEPCGHLICHRCFDTIRQARSEMRRKCPFCRGQIGGARPALLRSEVRASVLPGGADDGDSGGEVEAGMVKSGPLVRSLSEIETAFGILCDMGDEEEEVEEIDLEEARRTSVVSIASVAQHSD